MQNTGKIFLAFWNAIFVGLLAVNTNTPGNIGMAALGMAAQEQGLAKNAASTEQTSIAAKQSAPWITLPMQAIRVSDDDGQRGCPITADEVGVWVTEANKIYAPAHVRVSFSPGARDCSEVASTNINNVMTGLEEGFLRDSKKVLAKYPGKLVVFFRHGPGEQPNGFSFSDFRSNFIVMCGFNANNHCGHWNFGNFAHELGHYLGLYHPFARQFNTVAEAEAFVRAKDFKPEMLDGDGIKDTPPVPCINEFGCGTINEISLAGTRYALLRDNVMSYYDASRRTVTPGQIAKVRDIAAIKLKAGMRFPSNNPPLPFLEAESLDFETTPSVYTSKQPMDGFGSGCWSGGFQRFLRGRPGDSLTLTLPIEQTGKYRLTVYLTQSPDFAKANLLLDGVPLGDTYDAYAPTVIASGPVYLGTVDLSAGKHKLKIVLVGKNEASLGYAFGIDCLTLTSVHSTLHY